MLRRIVAFILLGIVLTGAVAVVGDSSTSGSVTRSLSALTSGGERHGKGEAHGNVDND